MIVSALNRQLDKTSLSYGFNPLYYRNEEINEI